MNEILGYGEDAFTFWALKMRTFEILEKLDDQTKLSNCLTSEEISLIHFTPRSIKT